MKIFVVENDRAFRNFPGVQGGRDERYEERGGEENGSLPNRRPPLPNQSRAANRSENQSNRRTVTSARPNPTAGAAQTLNVSGQRAGGDMRQPNSHPASSWRSCPSPR